MWVSEAHKGEPFNSSVILLTSELESWPHFLQLNFIVTLLLVHMVPETKTMIYSGTSLDEHPSTADTHDETDNSESPDCSSIDFNT